MFFHDLASNSTLQEDIRSEEPNWSSLENEDIHLCKKIALGHERIDCPDPTINCPESGTRECSLPNNDQSPNPCEAIFDSSHTPTDNSEQQDKYSPSHSTSPRAWIGWFTMAMKNSGFKQSNSDHTMLLKHEISQLYDYLATVFKMKDLGGLKYFMGIEVARSQQGIFLSQRKYVLDLLTNIGLLDCKLADTPIVQNNHLGEYPDQFLTNK
ncbi:unnamed protein product [Prunus armeniaca]